MKNLKNAVTVQGAPIAPVVVPVDVFAESMAELKNDIRFIAQAVSDIYNIESTATLSIEAKQNQIASTLKDALESENGIGEPVSFAFHEAVRLSFGDEYRVIKVGVSDEAVRKAWSRAFQCCADIFDMKKPSSENAESIARKALRAKTEQATMLQYEAVPVETLREKAKALFNKAGDGDKKAKVEAEKILRVVDVRTKVEREQLDSEVKALKKSIAESLKKVDDVSVLSDILVMLEGAVMDAEADGDLS